MNDSLNGNDNAIGDGLWLGWTDPCRKSVGFQTGLTDHKSSPLVYRGDAHVLTCAPTGSGKFVSVVGPALATFTGSTIVVDLKGEAFQVWADCRRRMGQRVVLLDPFHEIAGAERDSINPLDILGLPGVHCDVECEMLAALMSEGHEFSSDMYWTDTGRGLIAGLLDYIRTQPVEQRHLTRLRRMLHADDLDYDLAVALDSKKVNADSLARDEFVSYLTAPADKTRPCIRTTAQTFVKSLGSRLVAATLETSTFELQSLLTDAEPLSLFLVFPVRYLDSHRTLLRLLLHVILSTISRRPRIPARKTLLICDETASLGELPALRQAITLLRGSGLICHTFWQDLSQIRQVYTNDFESILNNSGAIQVFGVANHQMAETWNHVLGVPPRELANLPADEQALFLRGTGTVRCRKLNYLRDAAFAGRFSANPRYELHPVAIDAEVTGGLIR
ncbi:MAG: type IV secretory system conjugative DNA transfer family protein [Planctomycetes bacterium]|nr:type IV secretory system conjugative DNA transfer family protein [Planctomycetota bacterium]